MSLKCQSDNLIHISAKAISAEVKRQWQKQKEQRERVTSLNSRENMILPQAIWCLGSSLPPKLHFCSSKLCCLPEPRLHSFWSSLKFSRTWLSPFSPAVLKLLVDTAAPILQQQEEMKEVLSTGTLSGQGQCSDPRKLAPDLAECARMSASLLLHSLRQLTKRSGFCGQTSKPSDEEWRCFFFLLLLSVQHVLAVGLTIKIFGARMH